MTVKKHSVEWTLKVGAEGGEEISALKSEIEKLGQIDAFSKLKKQTEDAEKEWKSATARVAAMARELSSAEKPTKKMAQEFDRAKTQAGRLKEEFEKQRLTLHNLRGELSQTGINTTKLASAQLQARARVTALQSALQSSNTEMGKTNVAAGSAVAGLNVLRGGVGGIQSALAGLIRMAPGGIVGIIAGIAGGAAVSKAFDAAKMAADYDTMGVAMSVIGRNAGYTRKELDEADKSLQKSGISMEESRKNIAKLVTAKIDLSKATTLARIAQDAAIPAQMNSSEAFGHLVDGIQSAQVEMLRTLGINVSFEQSYRDMAKQLGKTAAELTESEKMQARLNIVIKAASGIAGTYEESLGTTGKALSSLSRLEQDAKTKVGKFFEPALAIGVNLYTAALKGANAQLDKLLASADDGVKKSPLFSGVAATGTFGATIAGLLKVRELFTGQAAAEKEAADKSVALEEERASRIKVINSELAELKAQNLDSFLEKAKSTLKEAEAAEKRYAEEVKKYQEMADQARLSTQEKVRALLRTQMSDFDQYRDKQREAEESLAKAREAMAGGNAEAGESWARKAQEQFAQLNSEVKTGEQVFVSAAEANRLAVEGVLAAGKALEESYLSRSRTSEEQRLAEAERFQQTKIDIETLEEAMSRIQDLEISASVKDQATPVLDSIQEELGKIKDKTITIKVKYDVGPKPDGLATGGRVPGYAFGGRLPGYSRTDNMLGMIRGGGIIGLAGGEDVTNAQSSRVIYNTMPWLMPDLNKVRTTADLSRIIAKLQAMPMRGYADGGRVVEEFRATFGVGGKQASMTTRSRSEFEGAKALARELGKLQLVRGGQ